MKFASFCICPSSNSSGAPSLTQHGPRLTPTSPAHIAEASISTSSAGADVNKQPAVEDLSFPPRVLEEHSASAPPMKPAKRPRTPAVPRKTSLLPPHSASRRLDSVALQWKLGNRKVHSLPADALIKAFEDEITCFRSYSLKVCEKLAGRLRSAFEIAVGDPVRLADIKAILDPLLLRDEWIAFVKMARKTVQRKEAAAQQFGRNSVVGKLLGDITTPPAPPRTPKHPRGALRVASSKARKTVTFDVSSSSEKESGEYSVSSSDDEPAPEQKRKRDEQRDPLTVDGATKLHLRAVKSSKHVRDYPSAAVDWIANTFVNGSSHIRQIVAGRHKDLDWSRSQLARVAERIIALYDKVALREQMGDKVSADAKKELLKSEFRDFANIRLSLHVIRLGEVGAGSFHQQVEDEDARADFELSSGNPRAFKIFSKQLSNVQKQHATPAKRPTSSRRSRNRPSTPSNRGRRGTRRPRPGNRRRSAPSYRSRSRERNRGNQTPRRRPPPRTQKTGPQSNQS